MIIYSFVVTYPQTTEMANSDLDKYYKALDKYLFFLEVCSFVFLLSAVFLPRLQPCPQNLDHYGVF